MFRRNPVPKNVLEKTASIIISSSDDEDIDEDTALGVKNRKRGRRTKPVNSANLKRSRGASAQLVDACLDAPLKKAATTIVISDDENAESLANSRSQSLPTLQPPPPPNPEPSGTALLLKHAEIRSQAASELEPENITFGKRDREKQPAEEDPRVFVKVRVRGDVVKEEVITFRVYKTDPFSKLLDGIRMAMRIPVEAMLRLTLAGLALAPDETHSSAGVLPEDVLDCRISLPAPPEPASPAASTAKPAEGGRGKEKTVIDLERESDGEASPPVAADNDEDKTEEEEASPLRPRVEVILEEDLVRLVLKRATGEIKIKMNRRDPLHKAAERICAAKQLDLSRIRFSFDGDPVDLNKTPEDLGLEDDDILDILEK